MFRLLMRATMGGVLCSAAAKGPAPELSSHSHAQLSQAPGSASPRLLAPALSGLSSALRLCSVCREARGDGRRVVAGRPQTPLGTNLNTKVIQPFLASGVQSRSLQKPILVRLPPPAAVRAGCLPPECCVTTGGFQTFQPGAASLLDQSSAAHRSENCCWAVHGNCCCRRDHWQP